jgi:hypothetical protein
MVVSCETPDLSSPPQSSEDTHHIMWLVKRQAYELAFTTPKSLGPLSYGQQSRIHMRFKAQRHPEAFALQLNELPYFYGDLSCMMEYVQSERQKLGRSQPA